MQNHDPERLPNGMGRVTSAEKGPTSKMTKTMASIQDINALEEQI